MTNVIEIEKEKRLIIKTISSKIDVELEKQFNDQVRKDKMRKAVVLRELIKLYVNGNIVIR